MWATDLITWTARTSSSGSDTYTSGYTYSTNKISGKAGYVQDSGTAGETIISMALYKTDAALFATAPVEITFSAKLGGGSVKDPLDYNIYACFVDNTGADIAGTAVTVTSKITNKDGSDFSVNMPTANATSAYGIKIYHMKEDGWNARYYNFTLSYSNVATATWTLSPASAMVTASESTVLDLTTNYDGTLSFESEDESIATVSYNSSTKKITVNGIARGTTTINVTGAATANYKAISKTISVIVQKALAANCILYESFDRNDEVGGNDGTWSDISATPTPVFDLTGWTYETAYGASRCVRTDKSGYFLSPALGVAGNVTLKFKTESWGSDTANGYVDIDGEGEFDDSESITGVTIQTVAEKKTRAKVTLKKSGTWTEYTLKIIGVTPATKIKFSDNAAAKRIFFDEVEVLLDKQTVTIASSGYSTLASVCGLDFASATPAGLEAYVASAVTASGVTLAAVDEAPASTGVILKGTAGTKYTIPVKTDATFDGTNKLKAAVAATACAANEVYILMGGKFCLVTAASTVPAGKAYLSASDVPAAAPELSFIFNGEVTGVNEVNVVKEVNDNSWYNLAGQRVAQPSKGLYIVNGKKVIIK